MCIYIYICIYIYKVSHTHTYIYINIQSYIFIYLNNIQNSVGKGSCEPLRPRGAAARPPHLVLLVSCHRLKLWAMKAAMRPSKRTCRQMGVAENYIFVMIYLQDTYVCKREERERERETYTRIYIYTYIYIYIEDVCMSVCMGAWMYCCMNVWRYVWYVRHVWYV